MIIYKTTNLINGRFYVGKSAYNKENYYGSGKILNLAIKKYGKENFKKEIIEECKNKEELNEKEIYWIDKLDAFYPKGYNIARGGTGGDVYTNMPDDMRKKAGQRISKSNIGNKHTEETKLKISKKNSGRKFTEEHKDKLSKSHLNQFVSKETRKKLSNSLKGRPSPTKGMKFSKETCLKMSNSAKVRKVSKETEKKIYNKIKK